MLAVVVLGPAHGAHAAVVTAADGEPPFTKGTANSWFFGFTRIPDVAAYAIGFSHDGQSDGLLSPVGDSGVLSTARAGLASGSLQTECATEAITTADGTPGSAPPVCSSTVMDDTRPTTTVTLNGGHSLTNDARVAVRIGYSDDISYPWPGGSTFLCPSLGSPSGGCRTSTPAQRVFSFDGGCSSPLANVGADAATSSWSCNYDLARLPGGAPDGTWYLCAVEADYAIPDNPATPDQYAGHTSDEANLSLDTPSSCGSITVDRTPPVLRLVATPKGGRLGAPVSVSASAKDLSGVVDFVWHFGDGSPPLHGTRLHHRYKKPGRYRITLGATDAAGNTTRRTIVLHATKKGLVKPGCTSGRVRPSAPRHLAAGARTLSLRLRPTCGGTVRMALRRRKVVYARGTTTLTQRGTYRVNLPLPKLPDGKYELRVTFKPEAGPTGKVWTVPIRVGHVSARAGRAHARARRSLIPRTTRGAPAPRP